MNAVLWDNRALYVLLPLLILIFISYGILLYFLKKKKIVKYEWLPVQICVFFLIAGEIIEIILNRTVGEIPLYFSTFVFIANGVVCFSKNKNSFIVEVFYLISLVLGMYISLFVLIAPYSAIFTMHENFTDYRHVYIYLSHCIDIFVFLWLITIRRTKFTMKHLYYCLGITLLWTSFMVACSLVIYGVNSDSDVYGYDLTLYKNQWWWYLCYPFIITILSGIAGYIVSKIPSVYVTFNKKWSL